MKNSLSLIVIPILLIISSCQNSLEKEVNTEFSSEITGIIPNSRIEKYGKDKIYISEKSEIVSIYVSNSVRENSGTIDEGIKLLSKRLALLSDVKLEVLKDLNSCHIIINQLSKQKLTRILKKEGVKEKIEEKRLAQAYYIRIKRPGNQNPVVTIGGCSDSGLYYGLVSLCQLVDCDKTGNIWLPDVRIVDWPEIGLRLAKTSASNNCLNTLHKFVAWMPLYKINMVGLQFHGEESKEPGPFEENVKTICTMQKQTGIMETIVYFCPFRGKGYDFTKSSDRDAYVKLINWVFDQGAHGIEVDYNDWPGNAVPIEDVINLAYNAVSEKKPEAYILYCPPNRGLSQYRGEATPEMRRILSEVPRKVWPLWTGMTTLITDTLKAEHVEQWTSVAGRRPFLWINRVSIGVDKSFSRSLVELPEARVLPGELLPRELNRLFEGIHLNYVFSKGISHTLPENFSIEELSYFATVADYIWNPYEWDANESYKRAVRFVAIMHPLMSKEDIW